MFEFALELLVGAADRAVVRWHRRFQRCEAAPLSLVERDGWIYGRCADCRREMRIGRAPAGGEKS